MLLTEWIEKAERDGPGAEPSSVQKAAAPPVDNTEPDEDDEDDDDEDGDEEGAEKSMQAMAGWLQKAGVSVQTGTLVGGKPKKKRSEPGMPSGEAGAGGDEDGGELEGAPNQQSAGAPHPDRTKGASPGPTTQLGGQPADGGTLARSFGGVGHGGVELYASSGHEAHDHLRAWATHGRDVRISGARPPETIQKADPEGLAWRQGDLGIVYSTFEDQRIAKSMDGLTVRQNPSLELCGTKAAIHEQTLCKSCFHPRPEMLASCPTCGAHEGFHLDSQPALVADEQVFKSLLPKRETDIIIK